VVGNNINVAPSWTPESKRPLLLDKSGHGGPLVLDKGGRQFFDADLQGQSTSRFGFGFEREPGDKAIISVDPSG
jgi:hypothetical protein